MGRILGADEGWLEGYVVGCVDGASVGLLVG